MDEGTGRPLDLRKLAYFVAVAEELHFGRAAERLYIAQPVLSRQIRRLEDEVGTRLLERSSRHVALTPAGERLLDDARSLLSAAEATRRRMRADPDGGESLTIGFFVGDAVAPALRAFAARRPGVRVDLLRIYWQDQDAVLRDRRADVAFVHMPVDETELRLLPIRTEPRVAVLPAFHRCAGAESVHLADLAEDAVIRQRGACPAWEAFHNVDPRPDGRHPRPGPIVDNIEEKFEHVAAGAAIGFLPASAARAYVPPSGVVCVPVVDIAPLQVCLAWLAESHSAVIEDFALSVRGAAAAPAAA